MSNTEEQSTLPKPRKLPKQGRSRMLVESTKQACLQILKREGPRALTATRISEVAGVAMGSIYQYFPNVDAIVAMIYEDLTAQEIEIAQRKWATDWSTMSLEQSIMGIIRGSIRFHRNMLALDREFHQRFYMNFDLETWFNETEGEPEAGTRSVEQLIQRHQDQYPCSNPALQAFIINRTLRAVVLECVKYHPEYFEGQELANHLFKLCFAVLGHQPQPLEHDTGMSAPD
ncbi:MAG: TetR/AcrR family transcriptional regulator [Spongiibacteraceae bacterium]